MSSNQTRSYRDEDWLRQKYVDEFLTQSEIAEICGCDQTNIKYWMDKHGIEARDQKRRRTGKCWHGWSEGYEIAVGKDNSERVRIHRLAAVAWFGFDAVTDNIIHHEDNMKCHNSENNLTPMTQSEHAKIHDECRRCPETGRFS